MPIEHMEYKKMNKWKDKWPQIEEMCKRQAGIAVANLSKEKLL